MQPSRLGTVDPVFRPVQSCPTERFNMRTVLRRISKTLVWFSLAVTATGLFAAQQQVAEAAPFCWNSCGPTGVDPVTGFTVCTGRCLMQRCACQLIQGFDANGNPTVSCDCN